MILRAFLEVIGDAATEDVGYLLFIILPRKYQLWLVITDNTKNMSTHIFCCFEFNAKGPSYMLEFSCQSYGTAFTRKQISHYSLWQLCHQSLLSIFSVSNSRAHLLATNFSGQYFHVGSRSKCRSGCLIADIYTSRAGKC